MQISTEKFITLQEELAVYRIALNKALDIFIKEDISAYPIFIAHQDSFDAGIPIISRTNTKGNWNINMSTLEEFEKKKIIQARKIESFKKSYKSTRDFICFFVLSELGAQFIYLPRVSQSIK